MKLQDNEKIIIARRLLTLLMLIEYYMNKVDYVQEIAQYHELNGIKKLLEMLEINVETSVERLEKTLKIIVKVDDLQITSTEKR